VSFLELIKKRQSDRAFDSRPVEEDKIDRCLEAARFAPSACNSQPWKFYIVSNPELKNKIARSTFNEAVTFNKFSLEAPVMIVITGTRGNIRTKVGQMISGLPYYLIDIGIAAEHFCLQASEEGLGTCMIGWFNENKIKPLLNIPKHERVSLIIALGYTKTPLIRSKNRNSKDVISVKIT